MTAPEIAGLTDFSPIGEGSTFALWKARQASLGRNVSVWQISQGLTSRQIAHHIRMARLLAKLNHGALTQIFDVNPDATPPYILAEYVDSPSLSDIVDARGAFSAKEALLVASGVAEALAYAGTQAPLIIRNLKPQNIHLNAAGNLKLTDFSLAIIAHDPEDGPSIDGDDLVGTPNFVSPEHADGSPDIDQRSDMYSLGMVLYYLVTRKVPFDVPDPLKTFELQKSAQLPNPRELNPDLTPQFIAFLSRLTMKEPRDRYDSWGDVLADARRILSGKQPATRRLPPDARPTIILQNTVVTGGSATGPTPELDAVLGKGRRRGHPIAWLILVLWLAWLANCRLMNPLHLPEKFAPQISIPAIDSLVDRVSNAATATPSPEPSASSSEGTEAAPVPSEEAVAAPALFEQMPPNPDATIHAPSPSTTGDPLEDRAHPAQLPAASSAAVESPGSQVPGPAGAGVSAQPAQSPALNALAEAIGDLVRQGDFEAARAKCDALGTPEAKAASALLAQTPSPDEAVGNALLARQGQPVSLTYMGKSRVVTPVRLNGSTLVVKFSDANGLVREIPMAIAKIDAREKIAFLYRWAETPQQHAAAAIAALQAGDEAAFRHHVADAGPLAALLSQQ